MELHEQMSSLIDCPEQSTQGSLSFYFKALGTFALHLGSKFVVWVAADLVVGRAAVWSRNDLVSIDSSLGKFCWITEPLGYTDRVSDVGVVSSSFVLLGNFLDGAGASFSPFDSCLEKAVDELDFSF